MAQRMGFSVSTIEKNRKIFSDNPCGRTTAVPPKKAVGRAIVFLEDPQTFFMTRREGKNGSLPGKGKLDKVFSFN